MQTMYTNQGKQQVYTNGDLKVRELVKEKKIITTSLYIVYCIFFIVTLLYRSNKPIRAIPMPAARGEIVPFTGHFPHDPQ